MKTRSMLADMGKAYPGGMFSLPAWRAYMEPLPGIAEEAEADAAACIATGRFTWEEDFLPVLQAAWENAAARREAEASFRAVTEGLDGRMAACGLLPVEADVTLYAGLLSGAGWVTQVQGRVAVLLGVEKIIELGWQGEKAMRGLVWHELGHVYQAQHGVLERPELSGARAFLWQLFTEGVAMVFEQRLAGDEDFFHQDENGWLPFLEKNAARLAEDFARELPQMTSATQRYFGDWVRWEGVGDAGYFLGARFVQFICRTEDLGGILAAEIEQVEAWFAAFLADVKKADPS